MKKLLFKASGRRGRERTRWVWSKKRDLTQEKIEDLKEIQFGKEKKLCSTSVYAQTLTDAFSFLSLVK